MNIVLIVVLASLLSIGTIFLIRAENNQEDHIDYNMTAPTPALPPMIKSCYKQTYPTFYPSPGDLKQSRWYSFPKKEDGCRKNKRVGI
jgi:hypothetical protein